MSAPRYVIIPDLDNPGTWTVWDGKHGRPVKRRLPRRLALAAARTLNFGKRQPS